MHPFDNVVGDADTRRRRIEVAGRVFGTVERLEAALREQDDGAIVEAVTTLEKLVRERPCDKLCPRDGCVRWTRARSSWKGLLGGARRSQPVAREILLGAEWILRNLYQDRERAVGHPEHADRYLQGVIDVNPRVHLDVVRQRSSAAIGIPPDPKLTQQVQRRVRVRGQDVDSALKAEGADEGDARTRIRRPRAPAAWDPRRIGGWWRLFCDYLRSSDGIMHLTSPSKILSQGQDRTQRSAGNAEGGTEEIDTLNAAQGRLVKALLAVPKGTWLPIADGWKSASVGMKKGATSTWLDELERRGIFAFKRGYPVRGKLKARRTKLRLLRLPGGTPSQWERGLGWGYGSSPADSE